MSLAVKKLSDLYFLKPFKLGELCSRIWALLRRIGVANTSNNNTLDCGAISINFLGSRVTLNGRILELTNVEYRLLCLLVRNVNHIVSLDMMFSEFWDGSWAIFYF